MRVLACALLMASVALVGCIGDDATPDEGLEEVPLGALSLAGGAPSADAQLVVGKRLVGAENTNANNGPPFMPREPRPACTPENCESIAFTIHDTGGKAVAVGIEWEGQDEAWDTAAGPGLYLGNPNSMLDAVIKKDGEVVLDVEESFHYGGVGILLDPAPGEYIVETVARKGAASYYLTIRLQDADPFVAQAVGGELLPDLVAIPPDHPTFRMPFGHEAGTVGSGLVAGCGPDEAVEDQDRRCLRFAGIIGNQGPGDFLTVLEYDAAQASILNAGGHWEQVVRSVDGSERRVQVGEADYHEIHGHFHILDFVATQLYEYDEETGERGDPVGEGRKMGFCVIDGGLIDTLGPAVPPKYHGSGCCYLVGICQLDMVGHERFSMGMSPNWYDIYPWWRSDQYVEVTGVPDGVYELVSVINPDGLIEETDPSNNAAGTVLRITGDDVEVLSMWTQATLGPHPDADWGYTAQSS